MISRSFARFLARALWHPRGWVAAAAIALLSPATPARAQADDVGAGTWALAGLLTAARSSQTATLLPNGQVLVAGGADSDGEPLASAELYLPATGVSAPTGGLRTARFQHTATLLPNGKVLVVGGYDTHNNNLASAELYDPVSGLWTPTGSLAAARVAFTATLLPSGKVLAVGGQSNDSGANLASAELYDPASGAWTPAGSMAAGRDSHTATLLPNGKVLVAGGYRDRALETAELYDPANGSWTATGNLFGPRAYHTATLLRNGQVLVAGGTAKGDHLATAELYDPATGAWKTTGDLGSPRQLHTASLLPNGQVIAANGFHEEYMPGAELYDPDHGTWTATDNLSTGRVHHTATLLPDGQLLLAGGGGAEGCLASTEMYRALLGVPAANQPQITVASFNASGQLVLTGSGFSGVTVQVRWLDNDQSVFLTPDPAGGGSATSFTSVAGAALRPGYALVTVFANGVPSAAFMILNPSVPVVATAPSVGSPTIAAVTPNGATLGGNVTTSGGAPITERGVVYSRTAVNASPIIFGSGVVKIVEGGLTIGVFSKVVPGLSANTGYSVRAFATNRAGTSYSSVSTFTTSPPFTGADDAVTVAGVPTRIYPLANDRPGIPLSLVSVSNPAIVIDGRSLIVPGDFTGAFTYVFTTGATLGQARVTVSAGTPVVRPFTFSGLLRNAAGAIAGSVDITFPTSGRVATFFLNAGTTSVRTTLSLGAGGLAGARSTVVGTLTVNRNPDNTVVCKLGAAGGDLTGVLLPRHAAGLKARYNIALASIDPAIVGGAHAFVSILATGAATVTTILPDGTACTASTSLRSNNTLAFYAIGRTGVNPPAVLSGELVLANLSATDLTGEWAWSKPLQRSNIAGLHLGGVATLLTANGSLYAGQITLAGPGTLNLSGGNLAVAEANAVAITAGQPAMPAGSVKTWVLNRTTGTFTNTVVVPGKPKPVAGRGLYLPKSNRAWGFFPGTTVGGRVELKLATAHDEIVEEDAAVDTEPVDPTTVDAPAAVP